MKTHTMTYGFSNGGGTTDTVTVSKSAGAENNIDENIAQSQTNKLVAFAVDVSQLKSLWIKSSAAMTIKTNSSSAPDNTLTLAADVPVKWQEGDAHACPLTVDVTALYITTGAIGADGADLEINALVDPTV
jgi:hypothetical protein